MVWINKVIPAKAGIYRVSVWMPAVAGMTFFILAMAGCSSNHAELNAHFQKANESYKKADFDAAIKEYEAIISEKLSSSSVFYNLANSYFKKNDLGKAILNYERAMMWAPRDGDIKANLRYAQSFVKNPVPEDLPETWQRIFIHNDLVTVNEITWILTFLFMAGGTVFVLGLFSGWPQGKLGAVFTVFGILFFFHYIALSVKVEKEQNQAIILADAPARFEPEENATVHFEMFKGWKVKVIKESGGWVQLMRGDGKQGWVPRYVLEKI